MLNKITQLLTTSCLAFLLLFGFSLPAMAQSQNNFVANVCDFGPCAFTLDQVDLQNLDRDAVVAILTTIATYLIFIVGPIAVLAIILGGLFMIFGRGEQGWGLIKNALIGLVVVVLSFTVVSIITQVLVNF